jgi:Tfp pilus assembly protein PilV
MRRYHGQGLIETMITFIIIISSVVALLRFQNYLAFSNSLTQQQSEASRLTMKEVEVLRDFSSLTNYNAITSGTTSYTASNAVYTVNWTVTPYSNPDYKTIDVTTSWTSRYGTAQSMRLTSQVAGIDPGLSVSVMK